MGIEGSRDQFRPLLHRPTSPEDPYGVGVEHAGRLDVEGDIGSMRSLLFEQNRQVVSSGRQEPTAALIPSESPASLDFKEYTFVDIRFRMRRPQSGLPTHLDIPDVVAVALTYDQVKQALEEKGLKEGDDQNEGESFQKVDEIILIQKPDILIFPGIDALEHRMNYSVGWGQYLVLCGEQVEGGERVILVATLRNSIAFPHNPSRK